MVVHTSVKWHVLPLWLCPCKKKATSCIGGKSTTVTSQRNVSLCFHLVLGWSMFPPCIGAKACQVCKKRKCRKKIRHAMLSSPPPISSHMRIQVSSSWSLKSLDRGSCFALRLQFCWLVFHVL